jgi:hypothetical protein
MAEQILIRLNNNAVVRGWGYTVGIYTFGPVLTPDLRPNLDRWAIRYAKTGINIATFTDRGVCLRFLRWLCDTYGNISEVWEHCTLRQETPEDTAIVDAINMRSKHVTRVSMTDSTCLIR